MYVHIPKYFICIVLYGPFLKQDGIDVDTLLRREEVFETTFCIHSDKDMDSLGPFHPEDDGYVVTKLIKSEKYVLCSHAVIYMYMNAQ